MNRSESISKLAVALVKFNAQIGSIAKDAKNPFFKSQYVTLDNLIIHTRQLLQEQGLVVMQSPLSKEDGSIGIQTLLIHESGEFIESEPIYMKPAKANDAQQAGSIISYMRRYSYQAILNLNTGEDDDANRATHGKDKPSTTPPQSTIPTGKCEACGTTTAGEMLDRTYKAYQKHLCEACGIKEHKARKEGK